jgi:pimeloyl-ACP methyl ester carboxylesterase
MPVINTRRSESFWNSSLAAIKSHPYAGATAAVVAVLAASAAVNYRLAKKAERDNPPTGNFLNINGVRLHYMERGAGDALVLVHGNGSMVEDFASSGLIDLAAKSYRVITFDRPGFGHSERPRDIVWTPEAQAQLIYKALERLGVTQSIVLGHSWGASVAIAFALQYPDAVRKLVLASGYYYPTLRSDVAVMSAPAVPLFGDVLSFSVSPIASRMMWRGLTKKIFDPASVPKKLKASQKKWLFARHKSGPAPVMPP